MILSWAPACGQCRSCARGRSVICESELKFGYGITGGVRMHMNGQDVHHYGPATYASVVLIPERSAVKIRDDMPLEKAALIGCSVMTGVGAVINSAAARPGHSVAVFGCGGIGLNAVQGGRMIGLAADRGGHPGQQVGPGPRVWRDARAQPNTRRRSERDSAHHRPRQSRYRVGRLDQCGPAGVRPPGRHLRHGRVARARRTHLDQPAHARRPRTAADRGKLRLGPCIHDGFPRMVDLYLAGKLQIDELITHRYGIDEANEAFEALASGQNARGLIVF